MKKPGEPATVNEYCHIFQMNILARSDWDTQL
jgi:hypothetical protein